MSSWDGAGDGAVAECLELLDKERLRASCTVDMVDIVVVDCKSNDARLRLEREQQGRSETASRHS
jgi:hypothetical protein